MTDQTSRCSIFSIPVDYNMRFLSEQGEIWLEKTVVYLATLSMHGPLLNGGHAMLPGFIQFFRHQAIIWLQGER